MLFANKMIAIMYRIIPNIVSSILISFCLGLLSPRGMLLMRKLRITTK
jgi:hypothetical protein